MVLNYLVNKPLHEVSEYLNNPQKFCSVHPVIYKIEDKGKEGILIYEKMPFLFVPVKFRYPASIVKSGDAVVMKAVVMKIAHIHLDFKLEAVSGSTKILETVKVNCFLPIHFTMNRIFKKQHKLLFENIEKA